MTRPSRPLWGFADHRSKEAGIKSRPSCWQRLFWRCRGSRKRKTGDSCGYHRSGIQVWRNAGRMGRACGLAQGRLSLWFDMHRYISAAKLLPNDVLHLVAEIMDLDQIQAGILQPDVHVHEPLRAAGTHPDLMAVADAR